MRDTTTRTTTARQNDNPPIIITQTTLGIGRNTTKSSGGNKNK